MAKSLEVPEKYAQVIGVFPHVHKGRVMWCKLPQPGQLTLLQLHYKRLRGLLNTDDDNVDRLAMDINTKILTVVASQFLDQADWDFMENEILLGNIDTQTLWSVMAGGKGDRPDDDAEVETKLPVKKAVAKKAAVNAKRPRA